jgi:ABC-type glycerol-3-phosphate transport system substrate-binding protein
MVGWIYAFGGEITNPEADGYQFNTPETREAFEYLKDLQLSGCAWSDTEVEVTAEFANRRALLMAGSLLDIPAMLEAFQQAGSSDEWIVIPFHPRMSRWLRRMGRPS